MPVSGICLTRSGSAAGDLVVRLGVPLLDEYLEFLAGRCRPDTVLGVGV
jgi:integrase/recombinase XerD